MSEKFMSIDEVVEFTGYKKSTIYVMVHKKEIPSHSRVKGGRLFFKKEEILEWLENPKAFKKKSKKKTQKRKSAKK